LTSRRTIVVPWFKFLELCDSFTGIDFCFRAQVIAFSSDPDILDHCVIFIDVLYWEIVCGMLAFEHDWLSLLSSIFFLYILLLLGSEFIQSIVLIVVVVVCDGKLM
jgi:hypothetical protein